MMPAFLRSSELGIEDTEVTPAGPGCVPALMGESDAQCVLCRVGPGWRLRCVPPAGRVHRELPEWLLDSGVPRLFGDDGQELPKQHSRTAGPREQQSRRHRRLFGKL